MSDNKKPRETPYFQTTQWSLVLAASGDGDDANLALRRWCETHLRPITALFGNILRRAGDASGDADELAQEFILHVLTHNPLRQVKKDGGARFRTWITVVARNFYRNHRAAERAAVRGGGRAFLPLNATLITDAELDQELELVQRSFDRQWAADLLADVFRALRVEFLRNADDRAKKEQVFEALRPYLAAAKPPYEELSVTLGRRVATLRVDYNRLFQLFREVLRRVVASTLQDPAEVEDEIRYLLAVLATPARDEA